MGLRTNITGAMSVGLAMTGGTTTGVDTKKRSAIPWRLT